MRLKARTQFMAQAEDPTNENWELVIVLLKLIKALYALILHHANMTKVNYRAA